MIQKLNMLSWDKVKALRDKDPFYVLPISALEQHGCHLPLGTDDIILEKVIENVLENGKFQAELLLLPTVHYGNSAEHMDFPGTVSLDCSTIIKIVENLMTCMNHQGYNRLIIVNSHGGNSALFEALSQEWEHKFHIKIYHINFFVSNFFTGAQQFLETPLASDVHAGEIETSLLKYLCPNLVSEGAIAQDKDVLVTLDDFYSGWSSTSLSPENGVIGVASKADILKGQKIFEYMCKRLLEYLNRIIVK